MYRIEARADSPARARRIVSDELGPLLARDRLDDIRLLVSELVTNGVQHGHEGPITIDLRVNDRIFCAVSDHGPGPIAQEPVSGLGGWGLQLVERLSTRWGLSRSARSTKVWFEAPQS